MNNNHNAEVKRFHLFVHGLRNTTEYISWKNMRARCRNQNHKSYPHYGGRGISVCKRWDEFLTFLNDMGHKPNPELSIERKNNSGNYEPGNCVWADKYTQHNNTRANVIVQVNGERLTVTQAARKLKIPAHRIFGRLRDGFDNERLFAPVSRPQKNNVA